MMIYAKFFQYWIYRIEIKLVSLVVYLLDRMIIKGAKNNELLECQRNYFKKCLNDRISQINYLKIRLEVLRNIDLFLMYKVVYIEVLKEDRYKSEFIYSCIYNTLSSYAKEKGINGFEVVLVYSSSYNETYQFMNNQNNLDDKVIIVSRLNMFCNPYKKGLFYKDFEFEFVFKDCCLGVDNDKLGLKKEFDYILI